MGSKAFPRAAAMAARGEGGSSWSRPTCVHWTLPRRSTRKAAGRMSSSPRTPKEVATRCSTSASSTKGRPSSATSRSDSAGKSGDTASTCTPRSASSAWASRNRASAFGTACTSGPGKTTTRTGPWATKSRRHSVRPVEAGNRNRGQRRRRGDRSGLRRAGSSLKHPQRAVIDRRSQPTAAPPDSGPRSPPSPRSAPGRRTSRPARPPRSTRPPRCIHRGSCSSPSSRSRCRAPGPT